MIALGGSTAKLRLITSAAANPGIKVHVSYVDRDRATTPPTEIPDGKNFHIITATTTTICDATGLGANAERNVKGSWCRNDSTSVSNTVTLLHDDGTLEIAIAKLTLLPGEVLIVDDNGNPSHYDAQIGIYASPSGAVDPRTNDFRLSGVSATPVMTADNAALTTIYLAQWKGNRIALFDGVNWQLATPATEPSLAVTGRTTDLPFDIFAYLSAGVVTLEFLNWTNATTRATTLTRLDGTLTKTGDSTRRYLGTCRPRSATTFGWVRNTPDVSVKLDLWNVDNRVEASFMLNSLTNTWAYATATWRQAQALATMQVDVICGLQEETFNARLVATSTTATTTISRQVGIGYDSTTAFTGVVGADSNPAAVASECMSVAQIAHQTPIGRHFYAWLEIGGTGVSFFGDNGALRHMSGMTGSWEC